MCDVDAHLTRESCDLCASKLEKSKTRKYRDARNAGRRLAQWNHELNIGTKRTLQLEAKKAKANSEEKSFL
jgi:hypothetical protein